MIIIKNVITYGTFDMFHLGHLRLLNRAKTFGDKLIVAVSTDEFNLSKGKKTLIPFEDRCEILKNIKSVDLVIPETSWDQKLQDVQIYEINTFVIGDDWTGKFDFLKKYCNVIYLPRTEGISSTDLKNKLKRGD
ncbi:glycerol-3-phosphate cytidylyltransferase [Methanococcus maripaludis]|uniref:Glycerol-3-phosphate cytidylyltransferase n=1 Tax=Methanococcus maripaludis TaxID=39152 RepID=A0A7J9NHC2_METMI|nr:glycerol-3-phosphate cytidylyltransferase [Methanococcus maripaludis]MBA2840133.1 glycerol-3-phosphate cytidylyltransferase [Methanococcus maripaludis]